MFKYKIKILKKYYYYILTLLQSNEKHDLSDFLIIGAQKGGTTWLYHILKNQDEVFMPTIPQTHDPSEVRFYDERLNKGISWYEHIYQAGSDHIKGDKTPKYYLLPRYKISLIRKLQPDVKILLLLRCPIDRAWSDALMNLKRFDGIDYEGNESIYKRHLLGKVNRGLYHKHIKRWLSVFPQQQIKIVIYEELVAQPEKHLNDIAHFLEMKNFQFKSNLISKKFNSNPSISVPSDIERLLRPYFSEDVKRLKIAFSHLSFNKWDF